MNVEVECRQGVCAIRFTGDLDIYTVGRCRSVLLNECPAGASATLDMSRVTHVDTAGLQLLLAMQRYVAAGGGLTVSVVSEPVRRALALARLTERCTCTEQLPA